jgi:predicted nucleotidyltransferase
MLETMAARLGDLLPRLVFVGGSTVGLFITDPLLPAVRVTRDVDVITEATSRQDYHQIEERLRTLGFAPDMRPDAPICRWCNGELILDLMPADENILGFANRWYQDAIASAQTVTLPSNHCLQVISPPYFLATKLEAFHGRGKGDYWTSHDMEDIICVVDGRAEIVTEVAQADSNLRSYLQQQFETMLANAHFREAISGFLPGDAVSQARVPRILQRLRAMAD